MKEDIKNEHVNEEDLDYIEGENSLSNSLSENDDCSHHH